MAARKVRRGASVIFNHHAATPTEWFVRGVLYEARRTRAKLRVVVGTMNDGLPREWEVAVEPGLAPGVPAIVTLLCTVVVP